MRQLVYVMRFTGQVAAAGSDGTVLMVTASAPGTPQDAPGSTESASPRSGGDSQPAKGLPARLWASLRGDGR